MPNGTYGGVRGRKTKVGEKKTTLFSSYSIFIFILQPGRNVGLDYIKCNNVDIYARLDVSASLV